MELLRAWDLEDEILAGGVDADVWLWECPTLARAAEGRAHAVGYPSREQAAVDQPDRAGHRAAGLARGGAAPARRIAAGGPVRARYRSSSPSTTCPTVCA